VTPPSKELIMEDGMMRVALGDIVNRPQRVCPSLHSPHKEHYSVNLASPEGESSFNVPESVARVFEIFEDSANAVDPQVTELSPLGWSPDSWSPLLDEADLDYAALSCFDQLPPAFVEEVKQSVESMQKMHRHKFLQTRAIHRLRKENLRLRRLTEETPHGMPSGSFPAESSFGTSASSSPAEPCSASPAETEDGPIVGGTSAISAACSSAAGSLEVSPPLPPPPSPLTPLSATEVAALRSRMAGSKQATERAAARRTRADKQAPPEASVPMPLRIKVELEPDPLAILQKLREHRFVAEVHCSNLQELHVDAASLSSTVHRIQQEMEETRWGCNGMLFRIEEAVGSGARDKEWELKKQLRSIEKQLGRIADGDVTN